MDDFQAFHFPPDLFQLLVEAIPAICPGKRDVMIFFEGAGVPKHLRADLDEQLFRNPEGFKKHKATRLLLTRINRKDTTYLKERREVLYRVVHFDNFSACWQNDEHKARSLVEQIRQLVNVKDTFTRIDEERERERAERQKAVLADRHEKAAKAEKLQDLKRELYALFTIEDGARRGKALEPVLNGLFRAYGVLVREDFTLRDAQGKAIEQIDGIVNLDADLYLVELKWHEDPLGPNKVAQHLVRVFNRGEVRGVLISASGFTDAALQSIKDALTKLVFVCVDLQEIVDALEKDVSLCDLLRKKVQAAQIERNPFHKPIGISL